jgi:hypothetical protein
LREVYIASDAQIPTVMIQAGGEIFFVQFEIHKLINPVSNNEKFTHKREKSSIVQFHKEGDKTDSSYHRTTMLSNSYTLFSNILLSR